MELEVVSTNEYLGSIILNDGKMKTEEINQLILCLEQYHARKKLHTSKHKTESL